MVWYNLQHKHPWKFVKFYVKYLVITSMLHTFYCKDLNISTAKVGLPLHCQVELG